MKKYCSNCKLEFDTDARWCANCGKELTTLSSTPQGSSVQQDNRIHKGDKTDIAGDSISAQSVDKRTFITQTSETKMYCECQLSGSRVPMEDIRRCTKCHRAVSVKYFNEDLFLCKECYDNRHKDDDKVGNIPPIAPPSVPPIAPAAQPPSSTYQPQTPQTSSKSSSKMYWGFVACIVIIIGLGVKLLFNEPSGKNEENSNERTEVAVVDTVSSTKEKEQGVQSAQENTSESVKNPKNSQSDSPQTDPKPSLVAAQSGISAYQAGNYAQAANLLQKEADKGDGSAAYILSQMYAQGKGVSTNGRKAFSYMRQAAELDYKDAYYELAEMYRLGDGTETNRARAEEWYEKAVATNAKNSEKAAEKLNLY